jgi:hypothetical protein
MRASEELWLDAPSTFTEDSATRDEDCGPVAVTSHTGPTLPSPIAAATTLVDPLSAGEYQVGK